MQMRVAAVVLAAVLLPTSAARAVGVDKSCELKFVKVDPDVVNVAFPDQAAAYYAAEYEAVPGVRLRISGRFPHARYMSFHVYDNATRPLDNLADIQIAPDAGSINPFVAGADRTAADRSYTVYVDSGARPASGPRAQNTMYAGGGQNGLPNVNGLLIYRVYLPDAGTDETGGTGLPKVIMETTDASGPVLSSDVCDSLQRPDLPNLNEQIAALDGPPAPYPGDWPGYPIPKWRKTKNLTNSYVAILFSNPEGQGVQQTYESTPVDSVGGKGAFYGNLDNSYLAALINRGYGQVLAFRMRAPSFADTRSGTPVMPAAQLRYFSVCENEVASTRYVSCLTDDEIKTVPDMTDPSARYMTFVVSPPGQRPANATAACGVNWIPWGPARDGVIIYRHMLPSADFPQAIQQIPQQGEELQTMGDYHPRARYFADPASFEQLGCIGASDPPDMKTGPAS